MSDPISINIKGPSELKLTINISLDKTVRDLKDAISAQSDVEADRQRLIYSGAYASAHSSNSAYSDFGSDSELVFATGMWCARPRY